MAEVMATVEKMTQVAEMSQINDAASFKDIYINISAAKLSFFWPCC